MADAALAPAPPALTGSTASPVSPAKDKPANTQEDPQIALMKAAATRFGQIDEREHQRNADLQARADGMKPPTLEQVPPPAPEHTDPQKMWGSMAITMSLIGSLFTRAPLTTALNAAAGAITAFHKGDQEATDQAYKRWEVAQKNAMDTWNSQTKTYDEILAGLRHSQEDNSKEAQAERMEVKAMMTAAASAYQHEEMLKFRNVWDMAHLNMQMKELGLRQEEHAGTIAMQKQIADATSAYLKSPEAQPKAGESPQARALRVTQHLGQINAGAKGMTSAQAISAENTINKSLITQGFAKDWLGAVSNLDKIGSTGDGKGPVNQGALLEGATQAFNGNRAVRAFQLTLMTHDAGLWNRAEIAMQQSGKGGPLSPQMIQDLLSITRQYAASVDAAYRDQIARAQATARSQGLDPEAINSSVYDPKKIYDYTHIWVPGHFPMQSDIDHLKASATPANRAAFDKHFGQGSAAAALGN